MCTYKGMEKCRINIGDCWLEFEIAKDENIGWSLTVATLSFPGLSFSGGRASAGFIIRAVFGKN